MMLIIIHERKAAVVVRVRTHRIALAVRKRVLSTASCRVDAVRIVVSCYVGVFMQKLHEIRQWLTAFTDGALVCAPHVYTLRSCNADIVSQSWSSVPLAISV